MANCFAPTLMLPRCAAVFLFGLIIPAANPMGYAARLIKSQTGWFSNPAAPAPRSPNSPPSPSRRLQWHEIHASRVGRIVAQAGSLDYRKGEFGDSGTLERISVPSAKPAAALMFESFATMVGDSKLFEARVAGRDLD